MISRCESDVPVTVERQRGYDKAVSGARRTATVLDALCSMCDRLLLQIGNGGAT
jgi:hypothetical protein